MTFPKIPCSGTVNGGQPCKAYAIHGSDPPLCAAHSGRTGAPKGNTNAVTHGYYQKGVSAAEVTDLFAGAENVTLVQEAILIRVVLNRLAQYMIDPDTPPAKIVNIAPLIFQGSRALAFLDKHLPDPDEIDWEAILADVGAAMDWDLSAQNRSR
jgi:hypothetical protein